MVKGRSLVTLCAIIVSVAPSLRAQQTSVSDGLFSPLTSATFHKVARELNYAHPDNDDAMQRAMVFLTAAMELEPRNRSVNADVLELASGFSDDRNLQLVKTVFQEYVDEKPDFEILRKAARYMLGTADSRPKREELLDKLFFLARKRNPPLASEFLMELAQLSLEKGDTEMAKRHLANACDFYPYNRLAFERYNELLLRDSQSLTAVAYALDLRRNMDINPLNINSSLAFADYCEKTGLYEISAAAYEYAARLFAYASPDTDLPPYVYLPWSITSYSTPMHARKCLEIAEQIRQSDIFDIRAEALAGRAAAKIGNLELSNSILENAANTAEKMLADATVAPQVTALELSWFHAFAQPNKERALAWANRAYTADPNAPGAKSLFGYALAMNGDFDLAQTFVETAKSDQIAALTTATIQSARNEKGAAIATLKDVIQMAPLSLAAEQANAMLIALGSEYIPRTSPQIVRSELKKQFADNVVPPFKTAQEILSAKLNLGGAELSYGAEMPAQLIITNTSSNPLVITDGALFQGDIRIDAILSGDIQQEIPELIATRVRPSLPIKPGDYFSVDLDLVTGPLRRWLEGFPQASIEIDFTVYLDPVADAGGKVRNWLEDVPPIRNTVQRRGVELTRQYLIQRLDALASGQEGQKIRAVQLLTGLLAEQDFMKNEPRPLYRYVRVERPILLDAVKRGLTDENWKVRLHTIQALTQLPGPSDFELTNAVSAGLSDTYWPVRMMTLFYLATSPSDDFGRVLDWSAKYDSEPLVRQMASALGGKGNPGPSGNSESAN